MNTRSEELIEQRRAELRLLEGAYVKAKASIDGIDGKVKYDALIDELLLTIDQFTPGDSGDKAIALIAVAKRIARQVRAPRQVIDDYESRKAKLEHIITVTEAQNTASRA